MKLQNHLANIFELRLPSRPCPEVFFGNVRNKYPMGPLLGSAGPIVVSIGSLLDPCWALLALYWALLDVY